MLRRVFRHGNDEEYGNDGWLMEDMPSFNYVAADTIAHDVLEHFKPTRFGAHADELMALGSILYGRASCGWFSNLHRPDPSVHLGSDLAQLLAEVHHGKYLPRRTSYRLSDDEDTLQDSLVEAKKSLLDLLDGERLRPGLTDSALSWVRHGHRRAHRRYGRPGKLVCLFDDLNEKAGRAAKYAGYAKLVVLVNIKDQRAIVKEEQYDEYGR